MDKTILHVDMDAFFAAVEQRDHPEFRGKPVVVGSPPDRRGVVSAASYEARAFGIHSAMPSREAGQRCPNAIFLPVDMPRYVKASRHVFSIFERFTPLVEPLSIDEAFLDVTGSQRLYGSGRDIAEKIRAAIREEVGLTASVGLASNKFLAKLASDLHKPDGLTVVPRDREGIRDFLAPLPVGRIWGVGKVTQQVLEQAGLRTIGDLQTCAEGTLQRLVGKHNAGHIRRLAWGEDARDLETEYEEKSISREHTFAHDCADPARIEAQLLALVEDVGRDLRERGKYAGVVKLKVRWKGFETITRQRALPEPCCDDYDLRAEALDLFRAQTLDRPVRLIGFGVSGFGRDRERQLDLFSPTPQSVVRKEKVSRAVDGIRKKYGRRSVQTGRLFDFPDREASGPAGEPGDRTPDGQHFI